MTNAARSKRLRDRRKAGLVRVEVWVPSDAAAAVLAAIEGVLAHNTPPASPSVTGGW